MTWVKDNVFNVFGLNKKSISTVHSDDQDIVKLIDPEITNGPWIAGGAVLNWYNNEPVNESDIDVFFQDLTQFDVTFGKIMSTGSSTIVYSTENAVTIHVRNKQSMGLRRVQLIRKAWFKTAEEVIDRFDFTVCQLATDGYNLVLGERTAEDIKSKTLALVKMPPHNDIVKRIIKYVSYGYTPKPEMIKYIMENHATLNWNYRGMDSDYDAAF